MADTQDFDQKRASYRRFKQRLGLCLCSVYALAYVGFVAISIYDVTLMDIIMPFGLNLAVFYGLGLIALALLLGVVYSWACYLRDKKGGSVSGCTGESKPDPASPARLSGGDK